MAETYASGNTPGPIQLFRLSNAMSALSNELRNGRGMRDLKTLAGRCNDPKIISDSLTGFMKQQNLPDQMINFIENLDIYKNILNSAIAESQSEIAG